MTDAELVSRIVEATKQLAGLLNQLPHDGHAPSAGVVMSRCAIGVDWGVSVDGNKIIGREPSEAAIEAFCRNRAGIGAAMTFLVYRSEKQ